MKCKKTIFFACMLTAAFCSCSQDDLGGFSATEPHTLIAAIENEADTRMTMGGTSADRNKLAWTNGDSFKVFNASGGSATYKAGSDDDAAAGLFALSGSNITGATSAFFPGDNASVSSSTLTMTLPNAIDASATNGICNLPLYGSLSGSSVEKVTFKYMTGVLRLDYLPKGLKAVKVLTDRKIAGTFTSTIGNGMTLSAGTTTNNTTAENTVTVTFNNSAANANDCVSKMVYVPLPVGTYGSIKVVMVKFDGTEENLETLTNKTVERAHVYTVARMKGDYQFDLSSHIVANMNKIEEVKENAIGSVKSKNYLIYEFSVPVSGNYYITADGGTQKNGSKLYILVSTDKESLKQNYLNEKIYFDGRDLTNTGAWDPTVTYTFSTYYLEAGKTYYMGMFFYASDAWVGNFANVFLKYAEDQTSFDDVIVLEPATTSDYTMYANSFNHTGVKTPFVDGWAYSPNYITVANGYSEFHYDPKGLADKGDNRSYKGAELTCDYHTATEGWYGFKIYLPSSTEATNFFPMDENGIIIAQLFNQGCKNCWAGTVSIESGVLTLSHRHAMVEPTKADLATLETGKWYPVVIYFKVGKNNKARLRAWVGDSMVENSPTYDSGACNFGYGHWIDDDTMDDTGTNTECLAASEKYGGNDGIGCKFGLYVTNSVQITIRFDYIRALEGNPAGAFDMMKP